MKNGEVGDEKINGTIVPEEYRKAQEKVYDYVLHTIIPDLKQEFLSKSENPKQYIENEGVIFNFSDQRPKYCRTIESPIVRPGDVQEVYYIMDKATVFDENKMMTEPQNTDKEGNPRNASKVGTNMSYLMTSGQVINIRAFYKSSEDDEFQPSISIGYTYKPELGDTMLNDATYFNYEINLNEEGKVIGDSSSYRSDYGEQNKAGWELQMLDFLGVPGELLNEYKYHMERCAGKEILYGKSLDDSIARRIQKEKKLTDSLHNTYDYSIKKGLITPKSSFRALLHRISEALKGVFR